MSLLCSECPDRLEAGMEGVIMRSSNGAPVPSLDGEDFASKITHFAHFAKWVPTAAKKLSRRGKPSSKKCAECGGAFTTEDPGYIIGSGFCEGFVFSAAQLSRENPFVYVHTRHIDRHLDTVQKKKGKARASK